MGRRMEIDPALLGVVRQVVGAQVTVDLTVGLPSASPIIGGHVYRIGQIGTYVKIPMGSHVVFGMVTLVGTSEDVSPQQVSDQGAPRVRRWLEVQLIGEALAPGAFQRGVGITPTINERVYLVTESDLRSILAPRPGTHSLVVGVQAASVTLPATLDLDKFVNRHTAVLGATGTGKSSAVATIVSAASDPNRYPSARTLIIDLHGEYSSAFPDAGVFRIGDTDSPLHVPYWALTFDELAAFMVDRTQAGDDLQEGELRDMILEARRAGAPGFKAGSVESHEITADTPVPFDIFRLWYDLAYKNEATYHDRELTDPAVVDAGNPEDLVRPRFDPPGAGTNSPHRGSERWLFNSYVSKMENRLRDPRFFFMTRPGPYDGISKDLDDLLESWLGRESVVVLDFNGVPAEVVDIAIGVVVRLVFDAMVWGASTEELGPSRPLLIVFEEAHSYLPRTQRGFIRGNALAAVQRLAREGRKYGVGMAIISQRPSEVSETVLSQCGTFIAMRLSNPEDQARVRASLPDTLEGLTALLPALRTGEALAVGEAFTLPARIRFARPQPPPQSSDPEVGRAWQRPKEKAAYGDVVTQWRKGRATYSQPDE